MREVEEALARQVLYGGDLLTNLLEITEIDETRALGCVSESSGVSVGPSGPLPTPSDELRHFVPRELVLKHAFVPLARERGTLVVAVGEAFSVDAVQELSFSLSLPLAQRVAPLVRVKEALLRDYDVPIERRYQRLIAKMQGTPTHAGSMPPVLSRGPNAFEMGTPGSFSPRRGSSASPPGSQSAAAAPRRHSLRPLKRRRGPLMAEAAREELDCAIVRDDAFDVLFEYARQYFDYTVLFAVNGDFVEGWDAFGEGLARERVVLLGYPLEVSSLLGRAKSDGVPLCVPFSRTGLDAVIVRDLALSGNVSPLIVPVMVKQRCVAIVLGVVRDAAIDGGSIGEMVAFAGAAGSALERIIVKKKRSSMPPPDELILHPTPLAALSDRGLPEADEERHAMLADAARHLTNTRIVDAPSSGGDMTTPVRGTPIAESSEPRPTPARVPLPRPSSSGRSVGARHPPPSGRPEPSLPTVIVDVSYEFAGVVDRYVATEDEGSYVTLLRAGATAMPAIMAKFPGRIDRNIERLAESEPLPRAAECGPLLKLIAAQRKIALPFVLEHVADSRIHHRLWATFLLTELRYPEVTRSLVSRLFDDNEPVRRVAREAFRGLAEVHPAPTVDTLGRVALDTEVSAAQRKVVITMLGALESATALGPLVRALDDESDEVLVATDAALVELTRHDFGGSRSAWRDFQVRYGELNRVDWLIEALVSSSEELATAAHEELITIAKQDFGFVAALPSHEKVRAQKRARDWRANAPAR